MSEMFNVKTQFMRQLVATVLIDHNCLEKTFSEETTSGEIVLTLQLVPWTCQLAESDTSGLHHWQTPSQSTIDPEEDLKFHH